jgi:hypothetical protein
MILSDVISDISEDSILFPFADMKVVKIFSLTDATAVWEPWPGKKKDVYFWGEFENGVKFGIDSKGLHCLFVKS